MAAFLVSQPGAWIPVVNARQNQAINEMYCFGPPGSAPGEGKNCTVSRIKHTYLSLTSGNGSFHPIGPGAGPKPLGEATSAGSIGGFKEPFTFLRAEEEEEPCWARETKFTLSCSFKNTAGHAQRVGASAVWPRRQSGVMWGLCGEGRSPAQGGHSTRAHCPRLGMLPSLKDTGDHDKNSSIIFLLGILTKLFTPPAPHPRP